MNTDKTRIIEQQQRTIAKQERILSRYRQVLEKCTAHPVAITDKPGIKYAMDEQLPISLARQGRVEGAFVPLAFLRELGVISG